MESCSLKRRLDILKQHLARLGHTAADHENLRVDNACDHAQTLAQIIAKLLRNLYGQFVPCLNRVKHGFCRYLTRSQSAVFITRP